jgi:DNA polymerase IV
MSLSHTPNRKIIHVDMDAFYASVEQLDRPDLRGKPVAVGGSRDRGVVAAASYEARAFGIKSAMPSKIAAAKCPLLIFVKPRFDRYKELSHQIREIFFEYTDLVEPLSLDEAFLDVTKNKVNNPSATLIAREIRQKIKERLGLNASAGVSYNKFLAKVASDINKPNGMAVITPDQAAEFLEKLPIHRFFGIGKVTAEKMKMYGINTGRELKDQSLEFLAQHFGKSGRHYYHIVRGMHESEVKPNRQRKSLSAETTFNQDIIDQTEVIQALEKIHEELVLRMEKSGITGRTVTLKLKYQDFTQQTRSKSTTSFLDKNDIWKISEELLLQENLKSPIRLLGIGISNLNVDMENEVLGWQLKIDFGGDL